MACMGPNAVQLNSAAHLTIDQAVQGYTFDVTREEAPPRMAFCSTRPCASALESAARHNDAGYELAQPDVVLDAESAEMQRAANQAVMEDRWDDALALYHRLQRRVPWLAQTWAARAIVLLRRGWKGDALWALRDADTCAALSPHWPKAYETRIRCLRSLGQVCNHNMCAIGSTALAYGKEFQRKHVSNGLSSIHLSVNIPVA